DNIVIDHHISNIGYGKLNFIEESASSTCEVLHFIISKLLKIDVNIAAWLYTGMMTDTDNFSYSNTTPKTLRIAADLIETGIDSSRINFSWLKARSLEKFRMLATLRDHIIYTPDIGLIHMTISYDHMKSNNVKETDLNTISTSLNVIEEAAIVIFLREGEKGLTKASFRSKKVDVNQIAAHFGGGGHKLAAGCSFKASPEEAIEQIINYLRKIEVWKSF
ncbi:MAG: DHHA1 domain-containing protein, partial [Defluviitaleaceae bacterium]|nr:DHHA1 domain-containing protein [Defluviitaleaceae bacterium]